MMDPQEESFGDKCRRMARELERAREDYLQIQQAHQLLYEKFMNDPNPETVKDLLFSISYLSYNASVKIQTLNSLLQNEVERPSV